MTSISSRVPEFGEPKDGLMRMNPYTGQVWVGRPDGPKNMEICVLWNGTHDIKLCLVAKQEMSAQLPELWRIIDVAELHVLQNGTVFGLELFVPVSWTEPRDIESLYPSVNEYKHCRVLQITSNVLMMARAWVMFRQSNVTERDVVNIVDNAVERALSNRS